MRQLLNKRSFLVEVCVLRRSRQREAGVLVCPRRVSVAVVGGSDAEGEGGRNVEIRGTAMQCSCWSPRSDGVEFYMYQRWAALILAGWSLQIAPSATSVRQRASVRPCRGAALGPPSTPRPQIRHCPFREGLVSWFCIGSQVS